jgi:predicted RNA-binding protein with EMAP domain
MADFELPTLSLKEYDNALQKYLEMLLAEYEKELEKDESWIARAWGGAMPFVDTGREKAEKIINEMYNVYMESAEAQGVGPWLDGYEEVLTIGAPDLFNYTSDEAKQEAMEQALEVALKQQQEDIALAEEKRQFDETMGQRQAEYDRTNAFNTAQAASEQQKAKWERDQAIAGVTSDSIWNNMQAIQNAQTPFDDTIQSQQNAKLFEEMRQLILDELEPTDWASKYIIETKPNPFEVNQTANPVADTKEQVSYLKAQKKAYENELNKLQGKLNDSNDPLYRTETIANQEKALQNTISFIEDQIESVSAGPLNSQLADMANRNNVDYLPMAETALRYSMNPNSGEFDTLTNEQKSELAQAAKYMTAAPVKAATPDLSVPSWMQPFIAGSPSTINRDKLGTAITPSAQSWANLKPTQKDIWADYVGVSGGNTSDLLANTENMLTKSLNLGRTWANA